MLYCVFAVFPFNFVFSQEKVCFGEDCFYVEVVDTFYRRKTGLMGRGSLGRNQGMLFSFDEEGKYSFWMKNTLIPLDIIWMSERKEVVFIKKNAQPCQDGFCPSIYPDKDAIYVLEINAGLSDQMDIKTGDKADFFFDKE